MPDSLEAMDTTVSATHSYDLPRRESRAEAAAQAVEQRIATAALQPGTRLGTRTELGELLAQRGRYWEMVEHQRLDLIADDVEQAIAEARA